MGNRSFHVGTLKFLINFCHKIDFFICLISCRAHNNYFWIPPVAGSLGGIAGAYLYVFTAEIPEIHHDPERIDKIDDKNNEDFAMERIQVN